MVSIECLGSKEDYILKILHLYVYAFNIYFISSYLISGRWMVLIDAAKGCATAPPDLSLYPADFVVISFYKVYIVGWMFYFGVCCWIQMPFVLILCFLYASC